MWHFSVINIRALRTASKCATWWPFGTGRKDILTTSKYEGRVYIVNDSHMFKNKFELSQVQHLGCARFWQYPREIDDSFSRSPRYEALQASALTLVSPRWTNFCSMGWKLIWINFGTQSKLRHTAFRISNKNLCLQWQTALSS